MSVIRGRRAAREPVRRTAAIRSRRLLLAVISLLISGLLLPAGAGALSLEQVGSYDAPTYVTSDPADPDRIFVVERAGQIQLTEGRNTTTFLDIEQIVLSPPNDRDAGNDHGLLSIAFSPEYATDHLFYVAYSSVDDPDTVLENEFGEWHIDEFRADGDIADPDSRREVLTIEYPVARLHYGGQLHFGPDGYLYASTGDGGPQEDPDGNAQNLDTLLGKILRIDPKGSASGEYSIPPDNPFAGPTHGRDEVWSYGLRNPWRFSFDRLTGDLVLGDVGHTAWEEVDFETVPDPGKGDNFGWNCREGAHQFFEGAHPFSTAPPCNAPQAFTEPVFEYEHVDGGNCSITGGYVVRDASLGDLYGRYLYADFCGGELRSLDLGPPVRDRSEGLTVESPTSFGEDSSCRIYVTSLSGPVYRLSEAGRSGACPLSWPQPPPPMSPQSALCGGEQATIIGTARGESLHGTPKRDIFAGRGGADTIRGFGGNDTVCGGRGRDTLRGSAGDDSLRGGPERDRLFGGRGRDTLRGGAGDDSLRGGPERDRLFGGRGPDVCSGGAARDRAIGCAIQRRL